MQTHEAFTTEYKQIIGRLKKRFMRKPDTKGVVSSLEQLAKQVGVQGSEAHAAFVTLVAARCEEALNPTSEAELRVRAAKMFLDAELNSHTCEIDGTLENLPEAVTCYQMAIDLYKRIRRPAFAASLHSEVAGVLMAFGQLHEAAEHYVSAGKLLKGTIPAISAYQNAIDCKIRAENYEGALKHYLSIAETTRMAMGLRPLSTQESLKPTDHFFLLSKSCSGGYYYEAMASCEISVVLILLLLRGTGSVAPAFAPILERYRRPVTDDIISPYLSEELFLGLQSVVLAADALDCDALRELHAPLWNYLSPLQNELFQLLPNSLAI